MSHLRIHTHALLVLLSPSPSSLSPLYAANPGFYTIFQPIRHALALWSLHLLFILPGLSFLHLWETPLSFSGLCSNVILLVRQLFLRFKSPHLNIANHFLTQHYVFHFPDLLFSIACGQTYYAFCLCIFLLSRLPLENVSS